MSSPPKLAWPAPAAPCTFRAAAFTARRTASASLLAPTPLPAPRPAPPLALSQAERDTLLDTLNSEHFANCAPPTVYATWFDAGIYLGAVRPRYRLFAEVGQSAERRAQRVHPAYAKPELLATDPNQVWSWDITKLKGPCQWTCCHLYVVLDIFSRYVVGWMIAPQESAELAEQLIADSVAKQAIGPGTLTLHADRGSSMRSQPVWFADLEVAKSHSRP